MEEKYTIISATNRPENKTFGFAEQCKVLLEGQGVEADLFSLQDLPENFKIQHIYEYDDSPIMPIVNKFIIPANKFIFTIPEYNGSYPGILKVFLDAIKPKYFNGKKALLIGTSSGRAGNLRGMDHLTGVLHYLKVEVYSQKLPISSIENLIDETGLIQDKETIQSLKKIMQDFQNF